MTQLVIATAGDALIFAPMRHEFHCNILHCGYITENAADALDHMQAQHMTVIDEMEADLLAFQSGEREMFRLDAAQMAEIEDERIGADVIAPYIFF